MRSRIVIACCVALLTGAALTGLSLLSQNRGPLLPSIAPIDDTGSNAAPVRAGGRSSG